MFAERILSKQGTDLRGTAHQLGGNSLIARLEESTAVFQLGSWQSREISRGSERDVERIIWCSKGTFFHCLLAPRTMRGS